MASHTRSNSLPSRPHPFTSEFDDNLRRLRAFEATSSTSSSISHQLTSLQDLHDCINKMLLLPLTQQPLAQHQSEIGVDELLDGSLRLLDMCSTTKDALLQTKESTVALQSVLRRRHGGEIRNAREFKEYLASRKVVKKAISKALGSLKGMESKRHFSINKDQETIVLLKEAEAITLNVFESMLSFISGTETVKLGRWSVVSKLVKPKRIACEEQNRKTNEFKDVDAALYLLIAHKAGKLQGVDNVQILFKSLELCIRDLEEGLECLNKHLIKTRVSLLNILNH